MAELLPGIQAQQVTTSRVRTNVLSRTGQTEGEPVVLVHGNISSALFFQELLLALPWEYRGLAPDLRGFGETEAVPIDATRGLGDFADDLAALLAALNIWQAHFVGWSMGGGAVMQLLISHPELVRSLTLIDPVSPYGFGGTKGVDGELCAPDGAGSGGGAANPEYVRRLREGDRGADDPNTPRNVMNAFYFKPPFRSRLEETFMDSMLMTRIGDDFYPGDMRPSEHWPTVAPGDRGVLNTMAAGRPRLDGIIAVSPKPPILWVRGDSDLIVSDQSMLDFGTLGSLGYVPGWPGAEVMPPQPMVSQMRAVLQRYQAAGGSYSEEVIENAGHSPFIEQPARFHEVFFAHLARAR
ncbi:MAG TPA: alpha/beta fold hydrolase [Ktedonobacterales bacterium]|nr:alpha/beta fold hydrolase [Ktedonobacterales bacterium]